MTSPFRFKHPAASQPQLPTLSATQLSARNFIVSNRRQPTPASSRPSSSPPLATKDDIDDSFDETPLSRKRSRIDSFHEISSEEEGYVESFRSALETPIKKRPSVLVPQVSPDSPNIELSPSHTGRFLPNGLAEYTSRIVDGHRAISSVAVPRLDHEDNVQIIDSRLSEGGLGCICRVNTSEETRLIFFVKPTSLTTTAPMKTGDLVAISNSVKVDDTWICGSWHYTSEHDW